MATRVAIFNAGRIEQIGTPREVYQRPASRFVARFMGDANLLAPRVLSGLAEHPDRILCVRPEAVELLSPQNPAAHTVGEVTEVLYRGAIVEVRLALGDGSSLVVHQLGEQRSGDLTIGVKYGATWREQAMTWLA